MKAVGIDLGATHVRAVMLQDGRFRWLGRSRTPPDPEALSSVLARIARAADLGSAAIGLAAAPDLDARGRIARWPNAPAYESFDLHSCVASVFGSVSAAIDDCAAAAIGEHVAATWRCEPGTTTLYVGVGTGVGGGAVVEDRLAAASASALGLGHTPVPSAKGTACRCGGAGCVQAVASGVALASVAARLGVARPDIARAAAEGDGGARNAIAAAVVPLREAIAIACAGVHPDRIVVGGGVTEDGWLVDALGEAPWSWPRPRPPFWGDAAGATGAALLALGSLAGRDLYRSPFVSQFTTVESS